MRKGRLTCQCLTMNMLMPQVKPALILLQKQWGGNPPKHVYAQKTGIRGDGVWTDGTNIFYTDLENYRHGGYEGSNGQHYTFKNGIWELAPPMNWDELPRFAPRNVWTDGVNIYHSMDSNESWENNAYHHEVLNGTTWTSKAWGGLQEFSGYDVWSDGVNIYYSGNYGNYVLNGDTWEPKTWGGDAGIRGNRIWSDGENIYFDFSHVLNGDTWEEKTWEGLEELSSGRGVTQTLWSDGEDIFILSISFELNENDSFILNGNRWEKKDCKGVAQTDDVWCSGDCIWTDGTNFYASHDDAQYILLPQTTKIYSKANGVWVKLGAVT